MKRLLGKEQQIFDDMKKCFTSYGLKIFDELKKNDQLMIFSKFEYRNYNFGIAAIYHADGDLVEISTVYTNISKNKIKPVAELMNHINSYIMSGHFYVVYSTGAMSFRTAIHVTDTLNKDDFEWALDQVMSASYKFFPMIIDQIFTEMEPLEIIKKHLEEEPMEVQP